MGTEDQAAKTAGPTPCRFVDVRLLVSRLLFSLLLVDGFLQFGPRGKLRDLAGSDLDSGAGLRIAPIPRLSLRYRESAEAYQSHSIPFSQCSSDAAHCGINGSCSLRFADLASARDLVNQIGFIHLFLLAGLFILHTQPTPGGQKLVAELGNLTAGILLSPRRMSTVKIRARSLFRTPMSRIGAKGAGSGQEQAVENLYFDRHRLPGNKPGADFLRPPQARAHLHRLYTGARSFALAGSSRLGAESRCRVN